jgi:hypothetical protein
MLPAEDQDKIRALVDSVNRDHLHCTDSNTWERVSKVILENIATKKLKENHPDEFVDTNHEILLMHTLDLRDELKKTFYDPDFTDQILAAFQTYISSPFEDDADLVIYLKQWIDSNKIYLPLGVHLLPAFVKDMKGETLFSQKIMKLGQKDYEINLNAQSKLVYSMMEAFLAEVAEANNRCLAGFPREGDLKTAVVFSVKMGAGGHIAPHKAMAARLAERNFRVETIHYDADLNPDYDVFQVLGLTFEDGEPMTMDLYSTRWREQKHNQEVSGIVGQYIGLMYMIHYDEFRNYSGRDLLMSLKAINPSVIVTTLAYSWVWKAVAFRLSSAKTLMVASDVFFNSNVLGAWYRQIDLLPKHRQLHFGVMTDDVELLRDQGKAHDQYYNSKYPNDTHDLLVPMFDQFVLDSQVSVIGAPINPSMKATINPIEIMELRKKWGVPDGSVSVCISRGRYGFDADLKDAIECYRTQESFPKPVVLFVVCGENKPFYQRLVGGEFNDIGPNITIHPLPLLSANDFSEVRSISIADDIKAGGGSTFEGWYLISQGVKSYLLLTPGPTLWWELVNCWAMKKWGVGQVFTENESKVAIVTDLIVNGPKTLTNKFPDWKPSFDATIDSLVSRRIKHVL